MKQIRIYLFLVFVASLAWSCADEVGDDTVFGEVITKYELVSPKSNDSIVINTGALDETVVFTWGIPKSGLDSPLKYTLLFYKDGGSIEDAVWSVESDESGTLNQATVTFAQLKEVYDAGKEASSEQVLLRWVVQADNGTPNVVPAQVSNLIRIKLSADGLSSFPLLTPVSNSMVTIDGIFGGDVLAFKWGKSVSTTGSAVTYQLMFDNLAGDFSDPILTLDADNLGADTLVAKTMEQWNTLFEQNQMVNGNYQWTVVASTSGIQWKKAVNKMFLESKNWTNPIYIVGDATPIAWDLDKALTMKFISSNFWSSVVTLTDTKEFKFLRAKGSLDNAITSDMFTQFINCEKLDNGNIRVNTGKTGAFVVVVNLSAKRVSVFEFPYLVGGSTIVDWNTDNAYPLMRVSKGLFETYEYVTVDGYGFKFLPSKGWDGDFGKSKTEDGSLTQENEDNLSVETNGFYRIRADLNNMTYRVDPVIWGIVGTATAGGTTTSTPMAMGTEAKGQYTWSVDANLTVGSLKFRANDATTINLGDNGNNGSMEYGGANISIATAGSYHIELVLNSQAGYSYSITPN